MKMHFSNFSISRALIAYATVTAMILTIVISAGVYYQVGRSVEKMQEEIIKQDMLGIRQAIHSFLENHLIVLSDIAQFPILTQETGRTKSGNANLADFMKNMSILGHKSQIVLLDHQGRVIHATLNAPLFDYTGEQWLSDFTKGISHRYIGLSKKSTAEDSHWYWRIAVPVYVQSRPECILVAEINLSELANFHYIPDNLDYHQISLLHNGDLVTEFGLKLKGEVQELPMENPNLTIVYQWDRSMLDKERNTIIIRLITGILATAILFLLASIALANGLYVRPLQKLRKRVHKVYKSNIQEPLPANQRLEEISALAEDINWLIGQLRSREKALLETTDSLELRIEERTHELHNSREELQKLNETLEAEIRQRTDELNQTQSQLVMQEKMASVGQLAAGIAHELNNPINFVRTNFATLIDDFEDLLEMLKHYAELTTQLETEPSLHEQLVSVRSMEQQLQITYLQKDIPMLFEESERGFERIAKIIQSMRDFSRSDQSGDFAWANINKGIEDTLIIAQNEYKYHAEVITDLGQIDDIYCSLEQLNQVFLNLIINSAHAIASEQKESKGLITIKTWQQQKTIYCEIRDNGPGIAPDHRDRIFEPFYTTKAPGHGTGLGLSISYDIVVHKHNGTLKLSSPDEGGSAFTLSLPIAEQEETKHDGK